MALTWRNQPVWVYWIAALCSVLLSYDGVLRATVVNPDGICYLQSAATIGTAGLHAATQLCGQAQWPFYSMLIHGLAVVTHTTTLTAAFLLNGLLSLLSVVTFIYIVALLGGRGHLLWLAALTVLLAHEFNSVREYVIRDHGFWAFYLLSVAALMRYFRSHRWQEVVLWVASLVVATLFRVEGVIFMVLVPVVALLDSGQRLRSFLQLNTLNILAGIALGAYLFYHPDQLQGNRLGEIEYQFVHGLSGLWLMFQTKAAALGQYVLSNYSARDASLVLFLLLMVWYAVSVVTNLSLVYAVLVVYAWTKHCLALDKPARLVLWAYIAVNVLITAAFLVDYMFLTKRYLLALTLLLMLWVPFALERLIELRHVRRWVLPVVLLWILGSALGGVIDFGYSKAYVRDAGRWLAAHASAKTVIYSNDALVMFYSDHFGNRIFEQAVQFKDMTMLANGKWRQYEYLALKVNPQELKSSAVIQEIGAQTAPVAVFANKRGDEVIIYKVSH
jgi:hypothetical protein